MTRSTVHRAQQRAARHARNHRAPHLSVAASLPLLPLLPLLLLLLVLLSVVAEAVLISSVGVPCGTLLVWLESLSSASLPRRCTLRGPTSPLASSCMIESTSLQASLQRFCVVRAVAQ